MGKFEFKIKLNNTNDVVLVSKFAENYKSDIDIKSCDNHYVIDAKSMMGIFALDLSKEIIVSTEDIETGESFKNDIAKFVIY